MCPPQRARRCAEDSQLRWVRCLSPEVLNEAERETSAHLRDLRGEIGSFHHPRRFGYVGARTRPTSRDRARRCQPWIPGPAAAWFAASPAAPRGLAPLVGFRLAPPDHSAHRPSCRVTTTGWAGGSRWDVVEIISERPVADSPSSHPASPWASRLAPPTAAVRPRDSRFDTLAALLGEPCGMAGGTRGPSQLSSATMDDPRTDHHLGGRLSCGDPSTPRRKSAQWRRERARNRYWTSRIRSAATPGPARAPAGPRLPRNLGSVAQPRTRPTDVAPFGKRGPPDHRGRPIITWHVGGA